MIRHGRGRPWTLTVRFHTAAPGSRPGRRPDSWRPGAQDGGCWFFASASESGGGRFDLETPRGTCYWANSEPVAARERLGRPGDIVAHDEVAGIVISSAAVNPGRLADLMAGDVALRCLPGTDQLCALLISRTVGSRL